MELSFGFKLFLCVIIFLCSTLLFYLAAGTLNPTKLNMINITYYSYMIFTYIGASLAFLGYRTHYLIAKIRVEETFYRGYFYVALLGLLFPLMVLLVGALFRLFHTPSYQEYLRRPVDVEWSRDTLQFVCFAGFLAVSIAVTIWFYVSAGQWPLLPWFTGTATGEMRQILGRTAFINPYIKNLFMVQFPAFLSFFVYIKARKIKSMRWILLFVGYLLISIIGKTYDFQKAPVLMYLMFFFLAEIFIGRLKWGVLLAALGGMLAILAAMYVFVFHFEYSLVDPFSGPMGRFFFTQVAGFFHTVEIFPARHGYLRGESLPTILAQLFEVPRSWNRSANIIMQLLNPSRVLNHTAGVMNTVFMGEAYANWGPFGLVGGVAFVGVLFGLVHHFFLNLPKNASTITLYLVFTWLFSIAFQGGFVDFLYNANLLLLVLFFIVMESVTGIRPYHMDRVGGLHGSGNH